MGRGGSANGRAKSLRAPRIKAAQAKRAKALADADSYQHPESTSPMRPEVGTQAQFRKHKEPATYRYDSSLAPDLNFDGGNRAREFGEWLLKQIDEAAALPAPHKFDKPREFKEGDAAFAVNGLRDAVDALKRLGKPFLNWTGKAERLSFDVPTLPLFVHERLSTEAIIETLHKHKTDKQTSFLDFFGDPKHSISDQVLRAYEFQDKWVNRMILGDSLLVMNSLLHYEGMGGQVQMIYIDPPYGVKFGSNFQPFVRKRDVSHGDDEDFTREPEMVQAYRDTWELGLHSYLTYLRDRLLLARDLLSATGSVFVQISDENLHHVREIMDEVFGTDCFVGIINVAKTSGLASADSLAVSCDYLLWYAKDREKVRYFQLYLEREPLGEEAAIYAHVELANGTRRPMTRAERQGGEQLPSGARRYRLDNLTKPGPGSRFTFEFEGRQFDPGKRWWGSTPEAFTTLAKKRRLQISGNTLGYVRFWDDFPFVPLNNLWDDTGTGGFLEEKLYVVQTRVKIVERCVLMTTKPGDLVLDPTCGSGTSAYVSEQWGRRWITCDTSRVPLALARQRLLTATFNYFELKDEQRGPAGGFIYQRRQNNRGNEVGGIIPHVTLASIANSEPPIEEVLVDRPEVNKSIVRVTGPFVVEATIPAAMNPDLQPVAEVAEADGADAHATFRDRMLEVLRRSPVLQLGENTSLTLTNVRAPAKTLCLSAEAMASQSGKKSNTKRIANLDKPSIPGMEDPQGKNKLGFKETGKVKNGGTPEDAKPVAFVFGPENGAVSEKLVYEAAREAHAKAYSHLYVVGFAIQPSARTLIEDAEKAVGIPATWVAVTPDVSMGDLLKTTRASQVFSVCGLPEVTVRKQKAEKGKPQKFSVELLGLNTFDPVDMTAKRTKGEDLPAWFLDCDYNGLCFKVSQAFFPKTGAWENLKKALKGTYNEEVWDHLKGTTSAPFEAGEHGQVAVKVIDERGNELVVVKKLDEAE